MSPKRRRVLVVSAALVVSIALDWVLDAEPPGYAAAIGLGGCILIIIVSKWLGRVWLQRPEDYYERVRHD